MKVDDSGMPEETYWNSLFDIPLVMDWLDVKSVSGPIVEIGCGYGTFTVPVARETREPVYACDIDPSMIEKARGHVHQAALPNVQFMLRDVVEDGTGLTANSAGMVVLFNILHFSERRVLLEEAARILKPQGVAAIIHWRKDVTTPRGPALELRPDRRTILDAIAGLDLIPKGACVHNRYFVLSFRTLDPTMALSRHSANQPHTRRMRKPVNHHRPLRL